MRFLEGRTAAERYIVLFGAVATLTILVALGCGVLVTLGLGHWIELFNGATWPTEFTTPVKVGSEPRQNHLGFWFYTVLAARTVINLGAVLSAVLALCWFIAGGLEKLVKKQMETLADVYAVSLVGEMLGVLEKDNLLPPPEVEQRMYDAARKFSSTHLGSTIKRAVETEANVVR